MQRTGGVFAAGLVLVLTLGLAGCSSPEGGSGGVALETIVEVEKVPGVLVAPYPYYVQVDPAAGEDEIAKTTLAVREILDGLGEDRPRELRFVAVYPGDGSLTTEFTTGEYDDAERFEGDVRIWAALLDDGFTQVRYNVHGDAGDGVLNVHAAGRGESGPSVAESFDAMVGALGSDPESFPLLQTEALIGDVLATNRSGHPALPEGWPESLDQLGVVEFLSKVRVQFEPAVTAVRLTGPTTLTADQTAQVMAILEGAGVLRSGVTVTHAAETDESVTTLYGADS